MSLKFFHVVFVVVSTLMALVVAVWAISAWRADGALDWLALAGIAILGGCGLVVYGNRFLHKFRKLGIAGLVLAGVLGYPHSGVAACPACVGTTESALQTGMNMGIFALLGVIGFIAACFAYFFIYLALRARRAQSRLRVRDSSFLEGASNA